MADQKSRQELKTYFQTGLKPTQQQFAFLMDAFVNPAEDPLKIEGDRVGIGTTTPGAPLGVKAEPDAKAAAFQSNDETTEFNFNVEPGGLHIGSGGSYLMSITDYGAVGINDSSPYAPLTVKSNHSNQTLALRSNDDYSEFNVNVEPNTLHIANAGSNILTISDQGAVGINAPLPTSPLTVGANYLTQAATFRSNDGTREYRFDISSDAMHWLPGSGASQGITLDNDGKVGVNQGAPNSALHVRAEAYQSSVLALQNSAATTTFHVRMESDAGHHGLHIGSAALGLTVNTSGWVGIGEGDPQGRLHVNGTSDRDFMVQEDGSVRIGGKTGSSDSMLRIENPLTTETVMEIEGSDEAALRIKSTDVLTHEPKGKSGVIAEIQGGKDNFGAQFEINGTETENYGVKATIEGSANRSFGLSANISESEHSTGLEANLTGVDRTYGADITATDAQHNYGIRADVRRGERTYGMDITAHEGSMNNYGIKADVRKGERTYGLDITAREGSLNNYGIRADVRNGDRTYGLDVDAQEGEHNYGVRSFVATGDRNYAIHATAKEGATKNYAVYAKAENGGENVGLYTEVTPIDGNNYAIQAEGNVYINGDLFANNVVSDKQLKTKIQDIKNALNQIMQLQAQSFEFKKDSKTAGMNLPLGQRFGFMAQDLEKVFPNLVKDMQKPEKPDTATGKPSTKKGKQLKIIDYMSLIPILTAALQEQQAQIDALTAAPTDSASNKAGTASIDTAPADPRIDKLEDTLELTLKALNRMPSYRRAMNAAKKAIAAEKRKAARATKSTKK